MDYPISALLLTFVGAAGLAMLAGLLLHVSRPAHPASRRFGGGLLIATFVLGTLLQPDIVIDAPLRGIIFLSFLILLAGRLDDRFNLSWRWQLVFQLALAGLAFRVGVALESVTFPWGGTVWLHPEWYLWPSLILSVLWLVLLMNAMNWLDGTDGLMGSVAMVAFLVIASLSLKPEVNQPPVAVLSMILAGATLGFLAFNFPPARLVAGTSGSLFLGFILGVLSVFAGTKVATALLVLTLPIADAFWVIGERFLSGVSIFRGDDRHLHYKLRRLGWSDRKILAWYTSITVVIAFLALNTRSVGKLASIAVAFFCVIGFIAWASRKERALTPQH